MAAMTAKDYKNAIEDSAAEALKQFPDDVEMRSRLFVACLAAIIKVHDGRLSNLLDPIFREKFTTSQAQL